MICQILGLFRNTLTANEKYLVHDYENFSSPIQMQQSLKRKTFSDFSNQFLESISHCKRFEKKDDCHTYSISEIRDC